MGDEGGPRTRFRTAEKEAAEAAKKRDASRSPYEKMAAKRAEFAQKQQEAGQLPRNITDDFDQAAMNDVPADSGGAQASGTNGQNNKPVVMTDSEKLNWIMEKMGNMATKADMTAVNKNISAVEIEISDMKKNAVTKNELKTEIGGLTTRIGTLETEMNALAAGATATGENLTLIRRITQLETDLKAKPTGATDGEKDRSTTAVIGGLAGSDDTDAAFQFISDNLWWNHAPLPIEHYCKGDFKGLLFLKFSSTAERDIAVKKIKDAKLKQGDQDIWAKADLPAKIRARQALLFGIKRIMMSWGVYAQGSIWVNIEKSCVMVGNETIITVSENGDELQEQITDGWNDELNCEEFHSLLSESKAKFKLGGKIAKGIGKGKKGSKGDSL
jgi:hypothetical protein